LVAVPDVAGDPPRTVWLALVAEKGIRARLQEFSLDHGGTSEENQAIEVAR
jgi:hypothetical protein